MQKNNLLLSLLLALTLVGCSSTNHASGSYSESQSSEYMAQERQIVKEGSLSIEVESVDAAGESVRAIVSQHNGFVDSSFSGNTDHIRFNTKIPQEKLEVVIQQISQLGVVKNKSLRATDVTMEMIDIESRINNLVALRDRLRALLARANTVGEVIELERELTRVQTELDTIEARQKSLRYQVAMSSLEVTVSQERVLGPLGYLANGLWWVLEKLFVIK